MKTINKVLTLVILTCTIVACEVEQVDLSRSIFIEDTDYPGLPEYSEWGYNTFGTYIDRKPFISGFEELPMKIIVNNDTLRMILRGYRGTDKVDLKFSFPSFPAATCFDLLALDSAYIDLTQGDKEVELKVNENRYGLDIIEGYLFFKKAQNLYVDEKLSMAILSGYFNFKAFWLEEPVSFLNGRFDCTVSEMNFYNY